MKKTIYVLAALFAVASTQAYAADSVKPEHQHASSVCKRVQELAASTLEARKNGHNDKEGDKARLGKDSSDPMFQYAIDAAYESDVNKTGIGEEAYDYCMLHKASA